MTYSFFQISVQAKLSIPTTPKNMMDMNTTEYVIIASRLKALEIFYIRRLLYIRNNK